MVTRLPAALIPIAMVLAAGCSEPADWSSRPLVPQEGVVEDVKFRWSVPEGMKRDSAGAGFALRGADEKQPSPRLQVGLERPMPASIAAAVKAARLADAVVSRREEVPGGFIVSGHSEKKDQILVNVWREHEGVALRCQAAFSWSKGIPSFDKTRAMLENVCLSMGAAE
ncbi:MAG TPA: hypothetical protein VE093_29800 [Polyangiaceae bacterium]|jgi:hypothetical protein|nr:hypothetical protein [Polyangiaceae bacterium]